MDKKRLGIMGSGYLGGIIAEASMDGLLEEYELVGIYGRNREKTEALSAKAGCKSCGTLEELLDLKPDYIAEAASVESVKAGAVKVLSRGCSLIVLSIGAFAEDEFYGTVRAAAMDHGARVYIASGAVGGFDVLRTISLMGDVKSKIQSWKGPGSLKNTPLFQDHLMTDEDSSQVFEGSAREAIGLLPTKVNVAVATSLASAGPDQTAMNICSVPGMAGDEFKITAGIEGFKTEVDIYSVNSSIAAWSVVAVLRNIVSPIVF